MWRQHHDKSLKTSHWGRFSIDDAQGVKSFSARKLPEGLAKLARVPEFLLYGSVCTPADLWLVWLLLKSICRKTKCLPCCYDKRQRLFCCLTHRCLLMWTVLVSHIHLGDEQSVTFGSALILETHRKHSGPCGKVPVISSNRVSMTGIHTKTL